MLTTFLRHKRGNLSRRGIASAGTMSVLLLLGQTAPLLANPTGGDVVSGAAAIGSAGSTLTVNQSTQNAIINWQTFSIANGETTKFIVPNSSSATLNRVVGGNPSAIYGNLQSNGILYLVNPSGIVVGPSGRIDTASFLASTLDVSNQQFLAGGNMEFSGSSSASVKNAGVIHASGGDVYLIANQVDNSGTLSAKHGTVGLAAGSDILFQQAGNEHLFVQATPSGTKRATGIMNSGTIRAAAAELKAAGGNAYALAINNTGVIAATGYKKINGQVYLTSDGGSITNSGKISAKQANGNGGKIVLDGTATTSKTSGTVTNSGTVDASATVAGGLGGTISIKDMTGKTIFSGSILAKGGLGGAGGSVEVSGHVLNFTGMVDLTASGGKTGTLLLDPATLDVVPGTGGALVADGNTPNQDDNDPNQSTIGANTVATALASANVTLEADNSLTIDAPITWSSESTLTLSTGVSGSTLNINKAIIAPSGQLAIAMAADSDSIIAPGGIQVESFILQHGSFFQGATVVSNGNLPVFSANDFQIQNQSSFMRALGGDGLSPSTPFQIADAYGLQGIGSPSGVYSGSEYVLANNFDASVTVGWNGGAGFAPILGFGGTLDGQGHTVSGINVFQPNGENIGLFATTTSAATIENVNLTEVQVQGNDYVGMLVGTNYGLVLNSNVSGSATGGPGDGEAGFRDNVGGLVGINNGTVQSSSAAGSVSAGNIGEGYGDDNIGGLIGTNSGTVTMSSANTTVTGGANRSAGNVGGLVGTNEGLISGSMSAGTLTGGANNENDFDGGLVGWNLSGTVTSSSSSVNVTGGSNSEADAIGGLVGTNASVVTSSVATGTVMDGAGSTGDVLGAQIGSDGGESPPPPPPPPETTPPDDGTTPSTMTGGASNGGSNIVPPTLVPQTTQVAQTINATIVGESTGSTPPVNFSGTGIADVSGQGDGGLASASGNSGQVGSGDGVQLGGGQLNNVANPHASGALNVALGPVVYQNLSDAMKAIGDWADVPDAASGDEVASNDNGGETLLSGGDVAEMGDGGAKKIPADQAPAELRDAMNDDIAGLGY